MTEGPGPRGRPEVDLDMLASILDGDPRTSAGGWLELTTGMTLPASYFEDGDVDEDPDDAPDRWHFVPCQGSQAAWRDMSSFVESEVEDPSARQRLGDAINGRGAFRRFGTIVREYPDLREAWFAYRDERAHERARQWLVDQGLATG